MITMMIMMTIEVLVDMINTRDVRATAEHAIIMTMNMMIMVTMTNRRTTTRIIKKITIRTTTTTTTRKRRNNFIIQKTLFKGKCAEMGLLFLHDSIEIFEWSF